MSSESDNLLSGQVTDDSGAQGDGAKTSGGALGLLMPADPWVWKEARRLVSDKNIRVEDLAAVTSQDPIIVIELIKVANAMFFSGGKSPITSTRTAIVRLGSDVVLDTLEKIKERSPIDNKDVAHWFEIHRSRGKRTSIIARMLAETLARTLTDDCQVGGLLFSIGEMLAVLHFKEQYVRLAEELSRSSILYRLAQDYKFDVERMGINYLRRNGVPEVLLFAIDRDARSRTPERAIMKPLCFAAAEIVEAFDANRWDKLAPGKTLPPKSSLRMLQMNDTQYLKLYERGSEYLFAIRSEEDRKKQAAIQAEISEKSAAAEELEVNSEEVSLQDEIQNLLSLPSDVVEEEVAAAPEMEPEPEVPAPVARAPKKASPPPKSAKMVRKPVATKVTSVEEDLGDAEDRFNLLATKSAPKKVARVQRSVPIVAPPKIHSAGGNAVIGAITGMFNDAKSSEQLLSSLLQMLVDEGPFEKSALIVVSRDRRHAIVVAARGPNIGNGQKLALDDPLSPLAKCFSKVQSFGNRKNKASPFGSKAFALAPIDADHETPVALYADCGDNGALSFEARRVFRTVVEVLNQKLPQIPGGIPVELGS